ncbi:MAG: GlsB/YeaQ/YmgE family stress response membrane protein [Novosphingobium sp.]|nr:GlsB/YeaQ/YmgE family stress response membrane protein [Novosphingobium sp.]
MINLVASAIGGLIIGALARFFYPGHVHLSLIGTMLLGLAGSLLAGLVTTRGRGDLNRAGCLASVLGAILLIFIARQLGWHF